MFTMVAKSTRMTVSAVAAVAIVSFGAVALDQAHIASARRGTVEIGELTPIDAAQIASVDLPEVAVIAKRAAPAEAQLASATLLPEIVVVAKRVAHRVARSDVGGQASLASAKGSAEGALLK